MACVYYYLGYRPTISNELLYRSMVAEARWKMLGHVLHMQTDTPAQLPMLFALNGASEYKRRHCRANLSRQ